MRNFKFQKKLLMKKCTHREYILWWAENLSDSIVFLTLERVYQIPNSNSAKATHWKPSAPPSQRAFSKVQCEKR